MNSFMVNYLPIIVTGISIVINNFLFLLYFQCYMRALFDYEPKEDSLLPCKEIGLAFNNGDVLQVCI